MELKQNKAEHMKIEPELNPEARTHNLEVADAVLRQHLTQLRLQLAAPLL